MDDKDMEELLGQRAVMKSLLEIKPILQEASGRTLRKCPHCKCLVSNDIDTCYRCKKPIVPEW